MKLTKEMIVQGLRELKPELMAQGVAQIALFGSYARGEMTPYSDVDIAIRKGSQFQEQGSAYAYLEFRNRLAEILRKKFHRRIDIFDLDSQSPFGEQIGKELIYV